jgi:hypothetical protein
MPAFSNFIFEIASYVLQILFFSNLPIKYNYFMADIKVTGVDITTGQEKTIVGGDTIRPATGALTIGGNGITIGTSATTEIDIGLTNASAIDIGGNASSTLWLGHTGAIQIGVGGSTTFDALAGDIVIQASPSVSADNYVGLFAQRANTTLGFNGGYIDIIAGSGRVGLLAGDTTIRGGAANTGTAAGVLYLRGGDSVTGATTVGGANVNLWGGTTFAAAAFGGDCIVTGGQNTATAANHGKILLGTSNTRAVEIGASGIKIGFWGATSVVQQTSAALTNNVTVGGTSDVIANYTIVDYATDAATIRNDIYQLARKLKEIGDALRLYGILA